MEQVVDGIDRTLAEMGGLMRRMMTICGPLIRARRRGQGLRRRESTAGVQLADAYRARTVDAR